jgi:ABC-type sugar transport system permease subunit
MIILLANLQILPGEVYESARIDGANAFQIFTRITIPMLRNAIFFCITLATINSFKVFDSVNIITEGGPGFSTTVLVQCIYHYAFKEFRITYAAAVALVLFLLIFLASYALRKIENRMRY